MPYKSTKDLPSHVKDLPKEAQKMWMKVFNSAEKQYDEEGRAFATAAAAVNKKYGKDVWEEGIDHTDFEKAAEKRSARSEALSFNNPTPTPTLYRRIDVLLTES